jgi:chemotaxis protein MotD
VSVASDISASLHLRIQQSQSRSRTDASDRSPTSSFADLLDSATEAADQPSAAPSSQPGKTDDVRPTDKSSKANAAAGRDSSNGAQDSKAVSDTGKAGDGASTDSAADLKDAEPTFKLDAKPSGADVKAAATDASTATDATDRDTDVDPDVDPAAALQAPLIDPTKPPVAADVTIGAAPPPPVATDAAPAEIAATSGETPRIEAPQVEAPVAPQAAEPAASPLNAAPADQGETVANDDSQGDNADGFKGDAKAGKEAKADVKGDIKTLAQTRTDVAADAKIATTQPKSNQHGEALQQNDGRAADPGIRAAATPASGQSESETQSRDATEATTDTKTDAKADTRIDVKTDTKADAKSDVKAEVRTAPFQHQDLNVPSAASAPAMALAAAASPPQTTAHIPPPAFAAAHIQAQLQADAGTAAVPLSGVAVEIANQVSAGKHQFEIRLDPPELGRIDVKLDIDGDGNTTTRLVVERSDTLDLLKRDANQLERALQQAGLKTSDNALEFSLRRQFAQNDNQGSPDATRIVVPDPDAAPLPVQRQNYGHLLGLSGGLDIRV